MGENCTEGWRWSHISSAWIARESWNDREEIASIRARAAEMGKPIAWHLPSDHPNGPSLIYPETYAKLSEESRRGFLPLYALPQYIKER